MKAMMQVWVKPLEDSAVKSAKFTLVSPPWPSVGDTVRYLGTRWKVTKTSATRGVVLSVPETPEASKQPQKG